MTEMGRTKSEKFLMYQFGKKFFCEISTPSGVDFVNGGVR